MSEAAHSAVDAPVAPVRVLGVETQHETAEFGRGGRVVPFEAVTVGSSVGLRGVDASRSRCQV